MDSTGCFANLIDSLKTTAYRINVLIEVAIHSEKMRGNKNVTQIKRVFERLQSKTRRKYTYVITVQTIFMYTISKAM